MFNAFALSSDEVCVVFPRWYTSSVLTQYLNERPKSLAVNWKWTIKKMITVLVVGRVRIEPAS